VPGTLYVVSTPIGNLKDITLRALEILQFVDLIAAEDTRHTKILLKKYAIYCPLYSYYSYNQKKRTAQIIKAIHDGKNVALVSEAGTPGISDPGYLLIKTAIDKGIPVVPVPGPSALLTALAASGLQMNRFVFEGFLPAKKGRKKRLRELAEEERSVIIYEGPHRLLKLLKEIEEFIGNRQIVIGRELTKIYEEFFHGTIQQAIEYFSNKKIQGEFVVILGEQI